VSSSVPAQTRPSKPPPSWVGPAAVVGFLALTWWAWTGIGLSLGELARNASNAGRIIDEMFPVAWAAFDATVDPFVETVQIAIIGAVVGCSIALVFGFLASRVTAPGLISYLTSKGLMSVIRSVPDVLYALVFVAAFSIGPLPGILALIFFNIGVVAKLLSETVDSVDTGPLEAADATGATLTQRIRTAVFPQVLPNYMAYALYTFELNLRASTVLGLVGAGGIGQTLNVARTIPRYDVVALIIVEIFVIVFIVEAISIAVRRRLV
jgi:phosphonate transport system permease protein